jgi:hypothetical protein
MEVDSLAPKNSMCFTKIMTYKVNNHSIHNKEKWNRWKDLNQTFVKSVRSMLQTHEVEW